MGIVKVNRTGSSFSVYGTNACTNVIGTIYNNEVFTWVQEWSGSSASGFYVQDIVFRKSNGTFGHGWVPGMQTDPKFQTNITSLPYQTVTDGGISYYAFKMRRDANLYDSSANNLGLKAYKDRRILCKTSTAGSSHPEWLSVYKLENGIGTGSYYNINGGSVAFVDMGYNIGSTMGSDFSLIGSIG